MGLVFDSLAMDLFLFVLAFASALYWYVKRNLDYWKKIGVPNIPGVPFFGNLKDVALMRRPISLVVQDLYKQLNGYKFGGIHEFSGPALLIRDPELIKTILVKDFSHFQDRGLPINPKLNPLDQTLFGLSGPIWKILRHKLSPTFTSGKMKMMFHAVEECSRNLQKYLEAPADKGEVLELKETLARFSTDVIGTCAFGLKMNALDSEESEFRRMERRVFEATPMRLLRLLVTVFLPSIASIFRIANLEPDIVNFFMNAVKETVEYREKNNVRRNDFLQLMIDIKDKGGVDGEEDDELIGARKGYDSGDLKMDDGLFAAQAFVFFFAGFETSSTTMSFALHELAVNPDVQTRLREEIDEELEKAGGKITYDVVMNMKYLDKVVSETLRKYPPVPNLRRVVTIPYKMPGIEKKLENDIVILIPAYALHHDPQYFPEPDRFDPERFSEEAKARRPHYAYLPFGEGPRNCIGMRFGLMQTKMGLTALLSKYEFHVCGRTELPIRLNPKTIILSSTTGTILKITNRS